MQTETIRRVTAQDPPAGVKGESAGYLPFGRVSLEPGVTVLEIGPKAGAFLTHALRVGGLTLDAEGGPDAGVEILSVMVGIVELLNHARTGIARELPAGGAPRPRRGDREILQETGLDLALVKEDIKLEGSSGNVLLTSICPMTLRVRVRGTVAQSFSGTFVGGWVNCQGD
jgi:hypothetical protein